MNDLSAWTSLTGFLLSAVNYLSSSANLIAQLSLGAFTCAMVLLVVPRLIRAIRLHRTNTVTLRKSMHSAL